RQRVQPRGATTVDGPCAPRTGDLPAALPRLPMQGCMSLGVIRKVAASSGTIATLAGQPTNPDGSDPCCDGCFDPPECVRAFDLTTDPSDRLVIADRDKRVVERPRPSDPPPSCDDGDACTTDTVDPSTGCVHTPLGGVAGVTCSCAQPLAPAPCSGGPVPPPP